MFEGDKWLRPYVCDFCGASHPHRKALKAHQKIHLDLCSVPSVNQSNSVTIFNDTQRELDGVMGHSASRIHKLSIQGSDVGSVISHSVGESGGYIVLGECEEDKIKCTFTRCPLSFRTQEDLKSHVKETHALIKCPQCTEEFPIFQYIPKGVNGSVKKIDSLKMHMKCFHGPPVKCSLCYLEFRGVHQMISHKETNHSVCEFCRRYFRDVTALQNHIDDAHTPTKCTVCSEIFCGESGMRGHKKSSHPQCKICQKNFQKTEEVESHNIDAHTPSKCTICSKVYLGERIMKLHFNSVHPACNLCQTSYMDDSALKSHLKDTHATIKCEICPEEFNGEASQMQHMKSVHFYCSTCKKCFKSLITLEKHVKDSHSPTKCTICSKEFPGVGPKEEHFVSAHPPCEFCHEIFKSSKHLKKHVKDTHDIVICPVCSENIQGLAMLANHAKSEHDLQCTICQKSFETLASFLSHIQDSHNPTKCPECSEEFPGKSPMKVHFSLTHGSKKK